MLKIRLMRIGAKKKPFYRIVVQEERSKRTGGYVELIGTYNPLTEPKEVKIKQERVDYWIKQGAQLSEGFLRIIGKAPQRPPRKPKKEKKEEPKPVKEEAPSEEAVKSSESEAVSEVQSAPEEGVSEDTASEQTHSEAQETSSAPETTEPSGASTADEQPTESSEDKKE